MIDSAITTEAVLRELEHASIIAHNGSTFLLGMKARAEENITEEIDTYDNLIEELDIMAERIMEVHEELSEMVRKNRGLGEFKEEE